MYALDFEYDGRYLSDYGFVICNFGGASDMDVVSAGSKITFNSVPMSFGKRISLTGTHSELPLLHILRCRGATMCVSR